MRQFFHYFVAASALFAAACTGVPTQPAKFCESGDFVVDAVFEGGNFHQCTIKDRTVSIAIRPEDEPPINRSPWYSFRVNPKRPGTAHINLTFVEGYARYWPKVSSDGQTWERLPEGQVEIPDERESMSLSLAVDKTPLWISAQERLLPAWYDQWIGELSAHRDITTGTLGHSVMGRPIYLAKSGTQSEVIFLIGRQHPPEVTGALAMRSFVDTVLADTPLASRFRERFSIAIIPLINPDGVSLGHWRHNVNGIDLNRDWGPFTQPETQSVARLLSAMAHSGVEPVLMLDFHSTMDSLFYTQMPEEGRAGEFASAWLTRSRQRIPDFEFRYDPRPPSGQDNTKNYFFSRYGIPAITYEIGDEVHRQDIADTTPVFAEEMMRLMLER